MRVRVVASSLSHAEGLAHLLDDDGLEVEISIAREPEARRRAIREGGCEAVVVAGLQRPSELRELRRSDGAVVIVVGDGLDVGETRQLLEAHADAVVDEAAGLASLPHVVRATILGALCLPGEMRRVVEPISLSTRERQVLALMASGLSNQEIAEQMYLSENTVKSHAASAFRRLGVHSRREAVALVLGSSEPLRRAVLMSHPLDVPQRERAGEREGGASDGSAERERRDPGAQ